jgi:hypothetical protein
MFTATPFTTGGSSSGGSGGGGGGTSTFKFSCDIIRQRPIDNTEFKRTNTFDVTFAILNNGTATWDAGKDLTLLGNPGPTLTNPPGKIELPKMEPGDIFTVGPFEAQAPDGPGRYVIDFKLEGGFCYPYVAFYVVRIAIPRLRGHLLMASKYSEEVDEQAYHRRITLWLILISHLRLCNASACHTSSFCIRAWLH